MKRRLLAIASVALFPATFGACKQLEEITKDESLPAPEPSAVASAPPAAPAATATTAASPEEDGAELSGIPTQEDFEEEAAEDITLDNLEDELDDLEKEITAT